MRTPKEYRDYLKKRVITKTMLLDCLYSVNKRAKNFRDKEREYRRYFCSNKYAYDRYGNAKKCREKKDEYYKQKDRLLSLLNPTCIHKEFLGYERIRIYDDDSKYKENINKFVWVNFYFDYKQSREVWFGDLEDKAKPKYNYYLYYDCGEGNSFHFPITVSDVDKYGLKVINIDHLQTEGHKISDLVSEQFVQKILSLIESGNYIFDTSK